MIGSKTEIRRSPSRQSGWVVLVVKTADGLVSTNQVYKLEAPILHIDRNSSTFSNAIELQDAAVSTGAVTLERTKQGNYELVDAGSTNPVRVNGRLVKRHILKANDVIRVGNSLLIVDQDDPARAHTSSQSILLMRVQSLLNSLFIHDSTAGHLMRVDASLIEPDYSCIALWSPGVYASRSAAEWMAESWGQTLIVIEAVQENAANRLLSARPDEAILIDRIDFASPQQMLAISAAVERRSRMHSRSLTIISIDGKLRKNSPPVVEQAIAQVAEFELEIPPLAQRKADILRIIDHLIAENCKKTVLFDSDLSEHLLCYHWSGELSELKRTANWLTSLVKRNLPLHASALPSAMRHIVIDGEGLYRITEQSVRDLIHTHHGNLDLIAKHFGMERHSFTKAVRQEGINLRVLQREYATK